MGYKTTPEQRAATREWQAKNPFRFAWLVTRNRAQRKGLAFTITEDDVRALWPADGRCPVFGTPMRLPGADRGSTKQGPRDDSASIDRLCNAEGYVPGNVSIISWRANRLKNLGTPEEFAAVARWMQGRALY